jgi:hypothetical protein
MDEDERWQIFTILMIALTMFVIVIGCMLEVLG